MKELHNETTPTPKQFYIDSYLPFGKENAIKLADLSKQLHQDKRKTVAMLSNRMHNGTVNGYMLVSSKKKPYGYYLTKNPEECKEMITRKGKEAKEACITTALLKKQYEEILEATNE